MTQGHADTRTKSAVWEPDGPEVKKGLFHPIDLRTCAGSPVKRQVKEIAPHNFP